MWFPTAKKIVMGSLWKHRSVAEFHGEEFVELMESFASSLEKLFDAGDVKRLGFMGMSSVDVTLQKYGYHFLRFQRVDGDPNHMRIHHVSNGFPNWARRKFARALREAGFSPS